VVENVFFGCVGLAVGILILIFRRPLSASIIKNQKKRFGAAGDLASQFNTVPYIFVFGLLVIIGSITWIAVGIIGLLN